MVFIFFNCLDHLIRKCIGPWMKRVSAGRNDMEKITWRTFHLALPRLYRVLCWIIFKLTSKLDGVFL